MASIHVQNISEAQFYCLSVIIYLEYIKITFKNFKNVWFWYLSCPVCTAESGIKLPSTHSNLHAKCHPSPGQYVHYVPKLQKLDYK